MAARRPSLTRAEAAAHVAGQVFGATVDPGGRDVHQRNGLGIELEFLTGTAGFRRLDRGRVAAVVDRLAPECGPSALHSSLTVEPGGQLELSTPVFGGLEAACEAAANDLFRLDQACASLGIDLVALGADPVRRPERIVTAPRYRAMETYFDRRGPSGRTMMTNTAAIQINVGLGSADEVGDRWRLANALGPTFIACFANSPFGRGSPTGWQSSRLRSWWRLDPTRSAPVPTDGDPARRWLDYALAANVMLLRSGDDGWLPMTRPFPFGQWMVEGHELGYPTLDDFAYHLTTLFPPVRPKGWFELRMFDALPTPFWHVAVAVTYALLLDPEARDTAARLVADTTGLWVDAAQLGLCHPALARAGVACFETALDALPRVGASSATVDVVANYFDRWVSRGRSPADDRHDAWRRNGALVPERESPVRYVDRPFSAARR
jgi:glutamate--cysteine ligase